MKVLMANILEIWLNARMMKGILMIKIRTDSDHPEACATRSEIPVTPPSMNWLGRRNPFNPKLAENIPRVIKKTP